MLRRADCIKSVRRVVQWLLGIAITSPLSRLVEVLTSTVAIVRRSNPNDLSHEVRMEIDVFRKTSREFPKRAEGSKWLEVGR